MSFSKWEGKTDQKYGQTKGKSSKIHALSKTYDHLPSFVTMEFWDNLGRAKT